MFAQERLHRKDRSARESTSQQLPMPIHLLYETLYPFNEQRADPFRPLLAFCMERVPQSGLFHYTQQDALRVPLRKDKLVL